MMKKTLRTILLTMAMLLMGSLPAMALEVISAGDCGKANSSVSYTLTDNGLLLIEGSGEMGDFMVTYSRNDRPWATYENRIKEVIVEEGVTSIGSNAFLTCSNLTKVTLPASLLEIQGSAFRQCSKLETLTIPEGVTTIGDKAFSECSSLTGIVLPDSITSLGSWTFASCMKLTSIHLPDKLERLGERVLAGCTSLSSLELPESLTAIDLWALSGCTGLKELVVPANVATIGERAFSSCSGLEKVLLPRSLTGIASGAFASCSSLTDIYYAGTAQEWEQILVGGSNSALLQSRFHYESVELGPDFEPRNIDQCSISGVKSNYYYEGKPVVPKVTVKDEDQVLLENTDFSISLSDNNQAGIGSIVITGLGDYTGSVTKTFKISKRTPVITAKNLTKTGKSTSQSFLLSVTSTGDGKLSYRSGSDKIKVTSTGKVTIPAAYVGSFSITIKTAETAMYQAASKKITVKVNPSGTYISSLTCVTGGKVKVSWKVNTIGGGYQIQYSRSSGFKTGNKSTSISDKKKVSTVITGFTKGKTYYFRIRCYKSVNGSKYYSAWSKTKGIKVTK